MTTTPKGIKTTDHETVNGDIWSVLDSKSNPDPSDREVIEAAILQLREAENSVEVNAETLTLADRTLGQAQRDRESAYSAYMNSRQKLDFARITMARVLGFEAETSS